MENKKTLALFSIALLFGIVFSLSFINSYSVEDNNDIADTSNYPQDNWFGRLISKLFNSQETFTIYGRTLGCSDSPVEVKTAWFNQAGNNGKTIKVKSGDAPILINWFRGSPNDGDYSDHPGDSRQFLGEAYLEYGRANEIKIYCDAGAYWRSECYYEIYSCQNPCYSDSTCGNDEFCDTSILSQPGSPLPSGAGICKQEEDGGLTHKTQVYSCSNGVKVDEGEVVFGNDNFCNDPNKINYIISTGEPSGICVDYEPLECSTNAAGNSKVQIGINPNKISESTATDLLKSACTTTDQCVEGSTCKTMNYLIEKGYLTESEADQKLKLSKSLALTGGGAVLGVGACASIAGAATIATAGAGAVLFPLCAVVGGSVGFGFDTLLSSIGSEQSDKYGYCILDSSSDLSKYTGWAAFIEITGDDGVDGLITILGGLVLLGFLFGGKR
jgi:hypothetical protein